MNAYRIMMRRSDRFMMSAVALWCRCVSVWVHVRCGEMKLARSVKWWVCQSENGGCERPFFCGIRSRCGCHRSESHPATILTYLGTICTWEYLDYPYYPFVSLMSFGSMICVSSSVVHLSDCDQALACTSKRNVVWHQSSLYWCSLSFFSSHPSLALSLSLSFSSSRPSLALSLSVSVGVHILCMFIAEVIGAVEYERSFTHCTRYWSFCFNSLGT